MKRRVFSLLQLLAVALLVSSMGCDCSGNPEENQFFEPDNFGEYVFDGEPDIEGPDRLIFGDVPAGETARLTAEIHNIGRETLKVQDWKISDGFELSFATSLNAPDVILPGDSVVIGVAFASSDDEEHRGTITIESNDPDEGVFVIDLYVNARFPCLETLPDDAVDFGEVKQDERRDRTVVIRNCSPNTETTFDLLGIRGDDAFSFTREPAFERMTLGIGESVEVLIGFEPTAPIEYNAQLEIQSNDEFRPEHMLPLRGRGAEGICPTATIIGTSTAGLGDFRAEPNATFETIPLERLLLEDDSAAYEGKYIDRREWTLVSRPQDSSTALTNSPEAMDQALFLDLAGTYAIELKVWDNEGVQSCNTARATIHAVANEDIHIQLVWDTPNDPNQNDSSGSDVDLHLLHPDGNGIWNDSPWDCFWQNQIPDWATNRAPGVDSFDCERDPDRAGCQDDPSLDIDDVDGWGPENINLNNPELNTTYNVGVHYFSDHGYSISFATIRIFIGGVMRAEYRRQRLSDQEFWHVADIQWPSGTITPNGRVTSSFP